MTNTKMLEATYTLVKTLDSDSQTMIDKITKGNMQWDFNTTETAIANMIIQLKQDIVSDEAKKERKNNIKLVAVKITNNTDKVINLGTNAAFFVGNSMIVPMDVNSIKNRLKQSVPSHLFYLLLTPLTFTFNNSKPLPVGLILGPALSGGNMLVAGNANKKFYEELLQYDILNRDIQKGETVYGLVGFRNLDFSPLTIKITK